MISSVIRLALGQLPLLGSFYFSWPGNLAWSTYLNLIRADLTSSEALNLITVLEDAPSSWAHS
jgi:hypothetical protein